MFVVVDVEVPVGVTADAGVTVNGTEVTNFCLGEDWANSVGDCQHLRGSPLATTADVVELGIMLERDTTIEWAASMESLHSRHTMCFEAVRVLSVCAVGQSRSVTFGCPHLVTYRRARGQDQTAKWQPYSCECWPHDRAIKD